MFDATSRRRPLALTSTTLAVGLWSIALGAPIPGRVVYGQGAKATAPGARAATTSPLVGTWRVTRGVAAPWVVASTSPPDVGAWLGQTLRVSRAQVDGPGVLRCSRPRLEPTSSPAEGLFQGGLPAPATNAAKALGVATLPVAGVRLTCDAGVFEFHQPDAQSMLLAVDNVIWTLDRSPGSMAAATAPAGVVQRFLEQHMAGRMEFDSASVAAKRQFLSDAFALQVRHYLAKPAPVDEAPEINGDPFTDSQEYPTRFSVGAASVNGNRAVVMVTFSDAYRAIRLRYVLRRAGTTWRIDDVHDARGTSLRSLLR